jgi:hypothetical protein
MRATCYFWVRRIRSYSGFRHRTMGAPSMVQASKTKSLYSAILCATALFLWPQVSEGQPYLDCSNSPTQWINHGPSFYLVKFANASNDWFSCSISCRYKHSRGGGAFRTMTCSGIVPPQLDVGNFGIFCSQPASKIGEYVDTEYPPTVDILNRKCTKVNPPPNVRPLPASGQ